MFWLSRGKPEVIKTGRMYRVRYYDPVSKQCRVYKTRYLRHAEIFKKGWE